MANGRPGNLNYNVTGVSAGQYQTDANGNTTQGHIVYFRITGGQQSQVFIPDNYWSDAEYVQQAIQDAAQHLANVVGMTGQLQQS